MARDPNRSMSRRAFAQTTSALAAAAALPWRGRDPSEVRIVAPRETTAFAPPDAEVIRSLALRAIDAAKSAGASYADVRLIRIINQVTGSRTDEMLLPGWWVSSFDRGRAVPGTSETETHAVSVRALVDGAWGSTASPWWTPEEVVTLARDAVAQARDNARWAKAKVELAPAPVITGTWTTPMRIDPFSIPAEEKMAFAQYAYRAYRGPYRRTDRIDAASVAGISCQHVTRAIATSEGTYVAQQLYDTRLGLKGFAGLSGIVMRDGHPVNTAETPTALFNAPTVYGPGWEAVTDVDLWTLGREAAESAYALLLSQPPVKQVEIGQQTVVMDAGVVATLVDLCIGRAADFDRISGDEANAGGTSYLGGDPLSLLGNYSFGNPALTVTTTRAASVGNVTGLPQMRWDDEGIEHTPFTLIKDGVLQDLPTTRERAAVLAPYYQKHGRPVASNGCAMSETSFDLTTSGPPTLVLAPARQDVTFNDMVSNVPRGMTITSLSGVGAVPDFQMRQITLTGDCQQIVNGRLGPRLLSASIMIDAPQLWKNLIALGGPSSAQGFPNVGSWSKGEPPVSLRTSVVAVPATFSAIPVIDASRQRR